MTYPVTVHILGTKLFGLPSYLFMMTQSQLHQCLQNANVTSLWQLSCNITFTFRLGHFSGSKS